MGDEHTVVIDTPGAPWPNDTVEVTVTELSAFERMQVISKMPDEAVEYLQKVGENDGEMYGLPPKFEEFLRILLEELSDFPPDLLEEIEADAINALIKVCCDGLAGKEPELPSDETDDSDEASDVFDGIELDEDGTVDPDEWR